jgi:hypothetical protein
MGLSTFWPSNDLTGGSAVREGGSELGEKGFSNYLIL